MKRIVGLRPTGRLHIGHYFSVIRPALDLDNVTVLIALHHAPPGSEEDVLRCADTLRAFGVDPTSLQFGPGSLRYWDDVTRLMHTVTVSRLKRMPQYKALKSDTVPAHMLFYPILMACDLIGYDEVIVGEDQAPHVDFARDVCKLDIQVRHPEHGSRVMSLRDPSVKMSKSDPAGCLFLDDNDDAVADKIRKAVSSPEGVDNLRSLFRALGGGHWAGDRVSNLKDTLTDLLIEHLA